MSSQDNHFNFTPIAAPTPPSSRKKKYGFRAERIVKRRSDYRQKKVAKRKDERASKRLKEFEISTLNKDEFKFGSQESRVSSLRDESGSVGDDGDDEEEGRADIQLGSDDDNMGHEDFGGGGGDLDFSDSDNEDGRSSSNGNDIETVEEGNTTANFPSKAPSKKRGLNHQNEDTIEANAVRAIEEANSTLSKKRKRSSDELKEATESREINLPGSSSSSDDDNDEGELTKPIKKPIGLVKDSMKGARGNRPKEKSEGAKTVAKMGLAAKGMGGEEDKVATSIDERRVRDSYFEEKRHTNCAVTSFLEPNMTRSGQDKEVFEEEMEQTNESVTNTLDSSEASAKSHSNASKLDSQPTLSMVGDNLGKQTASNEGTQGTQANATDAETSSKDDGLKLGVADPDSGPPNSSRHASLPAINTQMMEQQVHDIEMEMEIPNFDKHSSCLSQLARGNTDASQSQSDEQDNQYAEQTHDSGFAKHTRHRTKNANTQFNLHGTNESSTELPITREIDDSNPTKANASATEKIETPKKKRPASKLATSFPATMSPLPDGVGFKGSHSQSSKFSVLNSQTQPVLDSYKSGDKSEQKTREPGEASSRSPSCRECSGDGVREAQAAEKSDLSQSQKPRASTDVAVEHDQQPAKQGLPDASVRGKSVDPAKLALVQIARCAMENVTTSIDTTDRGGIPADQRDSLVKAARDIIRVMGEGVEERSQDY